MFTGSLVFISVIPAQAGFEGKVVPVVGGDTIEVHVGKRSERVRPCDIDCPEKRRASGQRARQKPLG